MNKRFLKSTGRLAAALALVVGLSLASLGCCETCGKTTQYEQAKCGDSKQCATASAGQCAKPCGEAGKRAPCSAKTAGKKCPPDCAKTCCAKNTAKKCPPGCTKPCCKRT